jgi:hypothetical protein
MPKCYPPDIYLAWSQSMGKLKILISSKKPFKTQKHDLGL